MSLGNVYDGIVRRDECVMMGALVCVFCCCYPWPTLIANKDMTLYLG